MTKLEEYYSFNPVTGEYEGVVFKQPNTLSGPANSTALAPPDNEDGYATVFDGSAWSKLVDNRGSVYWDNQGAKMEIANIGETIPEGSYLSEPANHIGETYWLPDGSFVEITELGEVPSDDALELKPDLRTANERALDTNLNQVQFKAMLYILGSSLSDVENAIDVILTDETEKMIAKAKANYSVNYSRTNPLFSILAPELGFDDTSLNAAWITAVHI